MAAAKGDPFELKLKNGFFIVVTIALPPFPYMNLESDFSYRGIDILFNQELTPEEWQRIHFEDVSLRIDKKQYYIASNTGFIMYVTGSGSSVEEARRETYDLIKKIVIPDMMYRTDIGTKFIETDSHSLKEWGWI